MDLSKFKGIIFDMDGTLVDSMPAHMEAWRLTCQQFGYPFNSIDIASMGGVPTKSIAKILNQQCGLTHDTALVAKTKREFWHSLNITPSLIPITFEVFRTYHNVVPIAVGTGAERAHAEELLSHHGILNKLSALVTASDVNQGKPHPETFLTAAELMQVPASECVVFEDTVIGAQAAEAAGMKCILVQNGQFVV